MSHISPITKRYILYLIKHVFIFLALFCNSYILQAQTTVISPTGNGGFESGTTFAANGWTATTGTATRNQWVCNTGATSGFSGNRCAYVTNNTGSVPPPHTYNNGTTRVTHFYRNVSIPAGETMITLNFSWMGVGEVGYDRLTIWLVPTTYNPVYGTEITAGVPVGATQIGTEYSNQSSWTTASITIPTSYAGTTTRLVFQWTNDGSLGSNPPSAVDNISLISQTPTPPSNNECATATILTVNSGTTCTTSTSGTTLWATQSSAGCSGTADDDVWYSFTASAATHTVTVAPGTLSNAVFQLYSGNCGLLTSLGCVNNTTGATAESQTFTGLTPTATYFVRVHSEANGTGQGTFTICITSPPTPPANNLCANATTLPCGTTNMSGTTVNTIGYAHNTSCSMSNYGVWYTFTGDGNVNIISVTTTGYDVEMAIASGTCVSLTNITCQDVALSSGTETFSLNTVLGTTYYVYVAHYDNTLSTTGTFTISRNCLTPPVNNNCSGNTLLTVNSSSSCTSSTNGTTLGASQSQAGCVGTADDDVWYRFVATGTSHTITVTPNSLTNAVFEVFSGNCGSLTSIACINNTGGSNAEITTLTGLTPSTTYFVRVYSNANGSGQGTFTICVTTPVDPCTTITNIVSCGSTIALNVTAGNGNGSYTTSACGFSTPGNEFIYSFTPTISGIYNINQSTSYGYIDYSYKQASSGCSNTGWICIDDLSGTATSPYFTLNAGTQYYFLVDPESTSGGTINFSIDCPPPPPVNDNPCSSIELNVNTTCSFQTFTTFGATGTSGVPAPGCGNYSGGDVWFTAIVPSNGIVYIDSNTNDILNGALAVYSGTCSGLTLLQCDDNSSLNGDMPFIALTGQTPGSTLFIRFWENGNDVFGDFGICVRTDCSPGGGNGSQANACPDVLAGGLGLNGSDPIINNCSSGNCTTLEATYLQLGNTTNYTVQSIAYNPPYQFNCLQNPVSVNIDDVWSPIINLPFNFCFYGNTYSQCVIGSNGILSFNTSLASSSSGYSFSNNLPNTTGALFANSIYGVYHDIDPSEGGEVGWELVTLETGCRALVASWSNVPMFSNNSILYTGMMVLYEDTNIIEVYIKEKNIDDYNISPWNGGNAIVGLQNASGTQAVVAPGRNGLDTNWQVTNEAWRFTPAGASIVNFAWHEGSGTSGPIIGTNSTLSVCPTTTTTYTAKAIYTMCNGSIRTLTDETTVTVLSGKTWDGSTDNDWNKADNWTPTGIPTSSDCVIIPPTSNNPVISGTNYIGLAGNLTVQNGASLTVNSNNSITVTDWITVQPSGVFQINNSASLVQINNSTNTGNIVHRREANIRTLDYVYWSSPVLNYNLNSISTPYTPGPKYEWNTTITNPNGGQGNWVAPSSNIMTPGKGYIIRGPGTSPFNNNSPTILNGIFTGVPINGTVNVPIYRGNDQNTATHFGTNGTEITNLSDNWNLLGNPYPSAIRASQFLFDNNTKILGNIRLWTHGTLPSSVISDPFYGSFAYNYTANDYYTFNFTGTSCCPAAPSDVFIASGQGFFVQRIDGPMDVSGSTTVSFTNSMRSATYPNSNFYRSSIDSQAENSLTNIERHRFWLDILHNTGNPTRTLIGYIQNATMEEDHFFDCLTSNFGTHSIYSLIGERKFNIQGRALPFINTDEVPVGIYTPNIGTYTIALAAVDGIFEDQEIYLKDLWTNNYHDLKANPFVFTVTQPGNIDNRFRIVYRNDTLSINDLESSSSVVLYNTETPKVISNLNQIEEIKVYTILGQLLQIYENIGSNEAHLTNLPQNKAPLLVKIKLQTGETVTRKMIF